jgi:hypothetical protein
MQSALPSALIGYSGFVGSSLLRQRNFDCLYRSTNIQTMIGREFDLVVCCGASAKKWLANKEPERDLREIRSLTDVLQTIHAKIFVLISTVDVSRHPVAFDESSFIDESDLHPYGLHRRALEKFVETTFKAHLIVRLPGLVGPGLRKNVIFDFLNHNNLDLIDSRAVFQFYPMVNLWSDLCTALKNQLQLVHFTAEPISVQEVALGGFNRVFNNEISGPAACYDMRSQYAELFGGAGTYQYSRRESLLAIRSYAQSEAPHS